MSAVGVLFNIYIAKVVCTAIASVEYLHHFVHTSQHATSADGDGERHRVVIGSCIALNWTNAMKIKQKLTICGDLLLESRQCSCIVGQHFVPWHGIDDLYVYSFCARSRKLRLNIYATWFHTNTQNENIFHEWIGAKYHIKWISARKPHIESEPKNADAKGEEGVEPGEKANHRYRYILEATMQFSYVNLSIYTSLSSVPSSPRCEALSVPTAKADVQICTYFDVIFTHLSFSGGRAFGIGAAQRCRRFHIYQCGIDFHNPYLNIYILDSLSSSSSPPPSSSSSSTLAIDTQTCVYFWCAFHLQFLARRRHRLQAHSHCECVECVCLCSRLLWQNRRKGKFTQYQPVHFFQIFFAAFFHRFVKQNENDSFSVSCCVAASATAVAATAAKTTPFIQFETKCGTTFASIFQKHIPIWMIGLLNWCHRKHESKLILQTKTSEKKGNWKWKSCEKRPKMRCSRWWRGNKK